MKLEIGVSQRNCDGEVVCGDGFGFIEDDDITTIAVVDGLGHGPRANEASEAFIVSMKKNNKERSLTELMNTISLEMAGTRGAAAAIVRIDTQKARLSFCGVGNIEIFSKSEEMVRPVSTPGIVGRRIRMIRQFDYNVHPGEVFAIFSDGISSRFDFSSYAEQLRNRDGQDINSIASAIIDDHGKKHDDATCVVIHLIE